MELDEGEPLPDWRGFDAIVAMGGPMSATDDAELPWLTAEKKLIGEAVRAGVPFWGVCLGVQLLAASLGARVYPGPEPEVGLLPVTLTPEARDDPVFSAAPQDLVTLQWHGDTFDLPGVPCGLQARPRTRIRRSASSVHTGCSSTSRSRARWRASGPRCPSTSLRSSARWGAGAPAFLAAIEEQADEMRGAGRALFERWLDRVVLAPAAA